MKALILCLTAGAMLVLAAGCGKSGGGHGSGVGAASPPATPPVIAASPTKGEIVLTVRVEEYHGDMLHSTATVNGAIVHPDVYDAADCTITKPGLYAGLRLQIWGLNNKGGPLDERLRKAGNVVRIRCNMDERVHAPWNRGPTGFAQWTITLE
jgi:hypothetical protein